MICRWYDSNNLFGWVDDNDELLTMPATIISHGHLVKESKDAIAIASSRYSGQSNGVIVIPRISCISIEYEKGDKDG